MNNTGHPSFGYTIALNIWLTVPPILLAVGTFGTVLTIVVLMQRRHRKQSISMYLTALSVADMVVLWTGCLRYWIVYMYGVDIRHLSEMACKLHMYLFCCGHQCSCWLIIAVTAERFFAVWLPMRFKRICTPRCAATVITLITALFCILNTHLLYGFVSTETQKCFPKDGAYANLFHNVYRKFQAIVDFLIPFAFVSVGNAAIIVRVVMRRRYIRSHFAQQRTTADNDKTFQITVMLITLNVVFIVCIVPRCTFLFIYGEWIMTSGLDRSNGLLDLVWATVNMMFYTNNAVNFILYFLSGSRFRNDVRMLFSGCVLSEV